VNLLDASNVAVYGNATLGKSGLAISISTAVCYQDQSGPGPITPIGTPNVVAVNATTTPFGASGSVSLPTGSYLVGFCELNIGVGALSNNGNTAGAVIVTP